MIHAFCYVCYYFTVHDALMSTCTLCHYPHMLPPSQYLEQMVVSPQTKY